ncbi:hypothetical protein GCM10010336_62310 [Streptomyces goshikiensis]|nr:hypothetical protein GCM10010336_62310 [Streptomyces goshikiensis]
MATSAANAIATPNTTSTIPQNPRLCPGLCPIKSPKIDDVFGKAMGPAGLGRQ